MIGHYDLLVYHENAMRIIPGLKAKFAMFATNRDE